MGIRENTIASTLSDSLSLLETNILFWLSTLRQKPIFVLPIHPIFPKSLFKWVNNVVEDLEEF
jgi:hypothetical protein